MERFEHTTAVLADLVHINRDCASDCRSFIRENSDRRSAHAVLHTVAGLCRDCIAELHIVLDPAYGDPADATGLQGVIYHYWQEQDDIYFTRQQAEIIESCKKKLQGVKLAYEQALNGEFDLADATRTLLNRQLERLAKAIYTIASYPSGTGGFTAMA